MAEEDGCGDFVGKVRFCAAAKLAAECRKYCQTDCEQTKWTQID